MAVEQQQQTYVLWFGARLGPKRKKERTVNGVKIVVRERSLELPPSGNTRFGNEFAHRTCIAKWREAAKEIAQESGLPQATGRVRISAVVYRRTLGTADEDNDRARLKPLVDGLRDAGVLTNDSRGYVTYGPCTEARADSRGPGIELTLEAIP